MSCVGGYIDEKDWEVLSKIAAELNSATPSD